MQPPSDPPATRQTNFRTVGTELASKKSQRPAIDSPKPSGRSHTAALMQFARQTQGTQAIRPNKTPQSDSGSTGPAGRRLPNVCGFERSDALSAGSGYSGLGQAGFLSPRANQLSNVETRPQSQRASRCQNLVKMEDSGSMMKHAGDMRGLLALSALMTVLLALTSFCFGAGSVPLRERLKETPFKIAHEAYLKDNWEILVMDADGANSVNLTQTPAIHEHFPQVSPEERQENHQLEHSGMPPLPQP